MTAVYNHSPIFRNNIALTIIVTFHNQANYVDKCLSSILKQKTQYPFEIIIIDDASTDSTLDVVKTWANKYPNLISFRLMEKNEMEKDQISRVSKCRLKGLSIASGKYLCFLDGDDYFTSADKFEKQISLLEQNPKNCACLSCYMSVFEDRETTYKILPLPTNFAYKKYLLDFYLPNSTMIYRNVAFSCYDDNFDDNSISLSLFRNKHLCFLNEITFCHYKTKSGSWLNKDYDHKTVAIIKVIDDAIRFSNISPSLIYKRYRYFLFNLYIDRNVNKNFIKFLRPLRSKILKFLIYYKDINIVAKMYVRFFIIKLLIFSKLHGIFRKEIKK